ncbi:hypothetical protein KDU71_20525 [Carboxylicivirga sediminis]|uniref:Outer membrane protein beta-barrel domain-containing protein n=1 Tax=Carboxylicivirga sediminis TaxID=2006564 RepID=A0A941F704_9BACT|nr:hypothetical protein [Carboxylicivirga sediminis]MBR8537966.1 hypothetical protein [Carboxylicivirga sediminis]
MKKHITLFSLFLVTIVFAQDDNTLANKTKGYFNYTSIGMLIGSSGDEQPHITSFWMEHHYQLNQNLSMGLVTGLEWFDVMVLPLGPKLKLMLPQRKKAAYYWSLAPGYAIALEDMEFMDMEITDTKGGAFFNTEVGYLFPSRHNYNVFVAIGYRYHEFEFTRSDWMVSHVKRKISYNRFSVRLGVRLF